MQVIEADVDGGVAALGVPGRDWQRIERVDRMPAFLMTVVSASDHWMFVSSTGGLTAGRVDAGRALFPYETDDRLHDAAGVAGPVTVVRWRDADGRLVVWEPFAARGWYGDVERALSKTVEGDSVVFEEVNAEAGLVFRYRWSTSERFGFVRASSLAWLEGGDGPEEVEVLDGLVNVMPAGFERVTQRLASCLVDAYKRTEVVDEGSGLVAYTMESLLTDRAEPAEALRATAVWRDGDGEGGEADGLLLSTRQLEAFRRGDAVAAEARVVGQRGAYLVHTTRRRADGPASWRIVADLAMDQPAVAALRETLADPAGARAALDADLAHGAAALRANVASADGLQLTADGAASARHFANVLFNNMRGGVFIDGHRLPIADLLAFIGERNRPAAARAAGVLRGLGESAPVREVLDAAAGSGDADVVRLCHEYLPLTFSRRHGDPSRPWNEFAIHLRDAEGQQLLSYQGNWRDIFQNWEALCLSYPHFVEPVVAKFVNASTVDGFNPYRVSRAGIDWEVPDPADPWSHIGYWGDHQIVYLTRLLEASRRVAPGRLEAMLGERVFSYADVPYRLKGYAAIVADPHETIDFDEAHDAATRQRVAAMGTDGRLVPDADGGVRHVTLAEKLVVPVLAKLSNFVADGGVWLNTQRPEWNDANNALVGHGVSVVTLGYLRRHLVLLRELFAAEGAAGSRATVAVSAHVAEWLERVTAVFAEHAGLASAGGVGARERRVLLDALGGAFEAYRGAAYRDGPGEPTERPAAKLVALVDAALPLVDQTLRSNRRADGLYHAYNLLKLGEGTAAVERLDVMLEGQVSILSSGVLGAAEAADLMDALRASALYRADQESYILYPWRDLPAFMAKNVLPESAVRGNALLTKLLEAGDESVVRRDAAGDVRFHPSFSKAGALRDALDRLAQDGAWSDAVAAHGGATLAAYESVFGHHAFTGRSGSMYKYEGLGSIYWHMVAKLLLAVQECYDHAVVEGVDDATVQRLAAAYDHVRQGLSFNKTAEEYGAFPTDPYSHTPAFAGAQQPGMTGQVKEEVLTRFGELGVRVATGRVAFRPRLLKVEEFLDEPSEFAHVGLGGEPATLELAAGSLAFTLGQVPIVYRLVDGAGGIEVAFAGGATRRVDGDTLDEQTSSALMARDGTIVRVDVGVPRSALRS